VWPVPWRDEEKGIFRAELGGCVSSVAAKHKVTLRRGQTRILSHEYRNSLANYFAKMCQESGWLPKGSCAQKTRALRKTLIWNY
jgi:hypothetical protein